MWIYEKRLQYPINIATPNAALAKLIAAQYGGYFYTICTILIDLYCKLAIYFI